MTDGEERRGKVIYLFLSQRHQHVKPLHKRQKQRHNLQKPFVLPSSPHFCRELATGPPRTAKSKDVYTPYEMS